MRILVIGGGGRTGRQVVEQALGHGHDVRAFVRSTPPAIDHPRLEVVFGDVHDFDAVSEAVKGCTAVAITIGRKGGSDIHLHETAAANVVHAMAVQGSTRLAALSAAGTFARNDPNITLAYRARIATTARASYDDLEAMERRIMASDLDWTIVRARALSDDPATGHYRVSMDGSIPKSSGRIARADVAALVLKSLETDTYLRRAVVVSP